MTTINYDAEHAIPKPAKLIGPDIVLLTGNVDFDSSYPTGGEAFDISGMFPKGRVLGVAFEPKGGYVFEYDATNKKVKAYTPEVTPTGTFAGNALSTAVEEEEISSININRIYHGAVTGGPFQAGEVVTGGTSKATAAVNAVGDGYLDIEDIGLDSVYDLTDELLTDYIDHCALVGDPVCHTEADVVNNDPTALADKSWASIYASLISLKTKYNAHDTESGTYHAAAGTAHQVATADADTPAKAAALANGIKTAYTAHIADDAAHTTADATNTIAVEDSSITLETGETLTGGTSSASADSSTTVIDVWVPAETMNLVQTILNNSDALLDILSPSVTLASGDARVILTSNEIETLLSDGYTSLKATYAKEVTPAGTIAIADITSLSEVSNTEDLSSIEGVRFFAWGC